MASGGTPIDALWYRIHRDSAVFYSPLPTGGGRFFGFAPRELTSNLLGWPVGPVFLAFFLSPPVSLPCPACVPSLLPPLQQSFNQSVQSLQRCTPAANFTHQTTGMLLVSTIFN